MRLHVAPSVLLEWLALHLLLTAAVSWGGGIALFSALSVLLSAVTLEWQVSAWLFEDVHHLAHSGWIGIDEISPWMRLAVIAVEDQEFPEYWGFDASATEKAPTHNRCHDTRTRDVSTLSQQTAKNLLLWDGRSWLRKGLEAGSMVSIETVWSKKWILVVYLNTAEFSDGISDVEVAAQRYFHEPANQLAPGEVTLLTTALPNPIRYRANTPSGCVRGRQAWVLRQMRQLGGEGFMHEYKLYWRVDSAPGLTLPPVGRHRGA